MKHVLPILSLILGTLVASAAYGEESKTARVAFLLMGKSQAGLTSAFDEFREGLRELGWLEKQNIVIEYRWAGENPDRLPELAAELVRLKVDAIIGSTAGVRAAQQATTSIPIIMCIADDAVKQGFVTNLARPGGNITGMAADALELAKKRIEILHETVPKLSRIALLSEVEIPVRRAFSYEPRTRVGGRNASHERENLRARVSATIFSGSGTPMRLCLPFAFPMSGIGTSVWRVRVVAVRREYGRCRPKSGRPARGYTRQKRTIELNE